MEKRISQLVVITKVMRIFGVIMALITIALVIAGVRSSQESHSMIETINQSYAGHEDAYPTSGVDAYVEARIVGDDIWRRGALAANFGDYIEVRFRVASTESGAIKSDKLSISLTDGLVATNMDPQDYVPANQYISYTSIGIFEFGWKDWLKGDSVSTVKVYHDGYTVGELLLVPPCNEVDLTLILTLSLLALCIGLVGPFMIAVLLRIKLYTIQRG